MYIGELAKRANISVRTARYCETLGLIEPETCSRGGFRLYSQRALDKLLLLKNLKNLDLSLTDLRDLVLLKSQCTEGYQAAAVLKKVLNEKLKKAQENLAICNRIKEKLESQIESTQRSAL
jgi:DNA-binding transcriptional MerR regulator